MNAELLKALDKVVDEIKNMPKEELKARLTKSQNSEFAKTIDMLCQGEENV